MSAHLSAERADQYRRRQISAPELLAADDHLAVCEECRQRVSGPVEMASLISDVHRRLRDDARESAHLSYEQMVEIVDSETQNFEREALESHVATCASCADEVSDLRAFRLEVFGASTNKLAPPERSSFWEKFGVLLPANRLRFGPAWTATLALLFITACVAVFVTWRATRRPDTTLRATQPAPQASPETNARDTNRGNAGPTPSPEEETTEQQILLTLNDGGGSVTLDSKGELRGIPPLPAATNQAIRRALTTGKVEAPQLPELAGVSSTLLGPTGDDSTFALSSPIGIVTRSAKPTFRWRPLSGATSYKVAILDPAYNVVTTSAQLTTSSWTPPVALERGRVYSWQVTSLKDGKETIAPAAPAPEARFKVLDKATADELVAIERASKSHLVRGAAYARAGLLEDAERELRALAAANPDSPKARQLLQSVRAMRRR